MENINIYENIGKRTGGDIYIGVVGPVRAGKSTFIKRFMDLMVIPNVLALLALSGAVVAMCKKYSGKKQTKEE